MASKSSASTNQPSTCGLDFSGRFDMGGISDAKASMPLQHAILSASGANWWINCTKAPRFCENIPETPSEYAKQGTEAHTLCEYKLRKLLGEKVRDPSKKLTMYDNEMEEAAEGYSQFVYTLAKQYKEENPDTLVYIEQRVDFSNFVPRASARLTLL